MFGALSEDLLCQNGGKWGLGRASVASLVEGRRFEVTRQLLNPQMPNDMSKSLTKKTNCFCWRARLIAIVEHVQWRI